MLMLVTRVQGRSVIVPRFTRLWRSQKAMASRRQLRRSATNVMSCNDPVAAVTTNTPFATSTTSVLPSSSSTQSIPSSTHSPSDNLIHLSPGQIIPISLETLSYLANNTPDKTEPNRDPNKTNVDTVRIPKSFRPTNYDGTSIYLFHPPTATDMYIDARQLSDSLLNSPPLDLRPPSDFKDTKDAVAGYWRLVGYPRALLSPEVTISDNGQIRDTDAANGLSMDLKRLSETGLPEPGVMDRLVAWRGIVVGLSKARLTGLVVTTALAGCALAIPTPFISDVFLAYPYSTVAALGFGTAMTSAAANTINQIIEIPYDSQMPRTRGRPLVRGDTTPGHAALFALASGVGGVCLLWTGTNPLVACLAGGNLLLYTAAYTPAKRISQANTWLGAIVGAVPALMGWAAVTGGLEMGSLMLACLLYVWQFPHFMALSWSLRQEYARAGYAMTSVLSPDLCRRVALRHAFGTVFVCLAGAGCSAISLGPWAGASLGMASLPANLALVYYAWRFAYSNQQQSDGSGSEGRGAGQAKAARNLFRASLFHLPCVMLCMLACTYTCSWHTARCAQSDGECPFFGVMGSGKAVCASAPSNDNV